MHPQRSNNNVANPSVQILGETYIYWFHNQLTYILILNVKFKIIEVVFNHYPVLYCFFIEIQNVKLCSEVVFNHQPVLN